MDPFSAVLTVLASTAIRALIEGQTPSRADWAQASTAVLDGLLAERATTGASLERIEAKVDSLKRDQFDHPFGAGLHFLEQAQPTWREEGERDRLLAEARSRFVDAAAAAYDLLAALSAYWYLALTWLLLRSPEDCRRYLAKAADSGFEALVQAAFWASEPPLDAVREQAGTPLLSFIDRLLLARSAEDAATWELRREGLDYLRQAHPFVFGVQRTRRQLGAPASTSPFPHLSFGGGLGYGPEIVVDLDTGVPSEVGALTICVYNTVPGGTSSGFQSVDCELGFRLASQAPKHVWAIALLDEPNAVARMMHAGASHDPLPSRFHAQDMSHRALLTASIPEALPGRAILASGRAHTPEGKMSLNGGASARGWLRLASQGRPLAVEIRGVAEPPGPASGPFTGQARFVMLAPINE